jgi:2-succinyl-5-enolpyruvyl-6-hydroxy-3-cyclohexene-1-carboxylate synthase
MNLELAVNVLQALAQNGVEDFVICPGSRNSPFVSELKEQPHIRVHYGFEERSSAFFALGISRRTNRPVAIITTSGTAAGELLPAAMEGYFLGVPLILVTADRPKRMRLTGSPQTAFQPHLFGIYAPCLLDIEGKDLCSMEEWKGDAPCQINVCFEEPDRRPKPSGCILLPKAKKIKAVSHDHRRFHDFLSQNRPMALVSALPHEAQAPVARFLHKSQIPAYIEATSGLREKVPSLAKPSLSSCQSVLRIGGVPTIRLWRDLETSAHPLFSVTERPFPGLHRESQMVVASLADFFSSYDLSPTYDHLIAEENPLPLDLEERLIGELSEMIPQNSLIYLGNSLPIRSWDRAATKKDRGYKVLASRGLNGIDGQISTFLGLAEEGKENWAIIGDLTALYDLSAPWFYFSRPTLKIAVVVINNHGGKIFEKMYAMKEMLNVHTLSFKPLADLWKWDYLSWKGGPLPELNRPLLVEVVP